MCNHCSDIHSYCHSYNLTRGPIKVVLLLATILSTALSNSHCAMETKLTVSKLFEYLVDLTDWIKFAQHLPEIEERHIDQIKEENKGKVDDQKRALYKKWLEVYPDASWNDVIEALEKAERKDIALTIKTQEVKEKELTVHQDTSKGM